MTQIGTLLHPMVKCFWDGTPLHYQKVGGMWENMLQQATLKWFAFAK